MIELELKDGDGNTFPLNGETSTMVFKNTWTQDSDAFEFDNDVIEKSSLPGSKKVGDGRLMSREYQLTVDVINDDSSGFRSEVNELLEFVSRTEYVVDVTNDMQLKVVPVAPIVEYDTGSLKKAGTVSVNFHALTPYWSHLTEDQLTGTISADTLTALAIQNNGFLDTPPVYTLETTGAVPSLQLFLSSSNVGIQIDDALFGTAGNLTMIIDCEVGEVTIGSINRNSSIVEGTGFFSFPVGSDTLNMLFADYDVDYTIDFAKRYYV